MNDIKKIDIAKIKRDPATQSRVEMSKETVELYAGRMADGEEFPPVKLLQDGNTYWLYDGHHTLDAAELNAAKKINAVVDKGGLRDARLLSFSANATHGLHRTPEDIRKIVFAMAMDDEWGEWSGREIAKHIGVSHVTVNKYLDMYRETQLPASAKPPKRESKKQAAKKPPVDVSVVPDDSFDVEEIEAQPVTLTKRNGKPLVSSKDRQDACKQLAALCRSLTKIGIYDEFIEPLSAIMDRLKQI